MRVTVRQRGPASSSRSPLCGKHLLLCPRTKDQRAGCVCRNTFRQKPAAAVFTNVRRKSNILVYDFSRAKPVRSHSDPCQPPSCPHHLLQSTTWPLYAHLSPAIRSGHKLIHVPGISLLFV